MEKKAVFLDRDGVITEAIIRDGKAFSPRSLEELKLIPEAKPALAQLRAGGFAIFVVTNQPDIARKIMAPEMLQQMNKKLIEWMGPGMIEAVYVCPHDNQDHCECRKPKPGLLLQAANLMAIDYKQSYMVGDRDVDMQAGKSVNCKTVLIDAPYNRGVHADYHARNLGDACRWILARENANLKKPN